MPTDIEVFADVLCPFTHVGLRRLVERRHELGSTRLLRVRAWPLELVNGKALAGSLVAEEIDALRDQVAPDLFAGFDVTRFPTTSRPALALAAVAYRHSRDLGERVSLALRDALFEVGSDIAAPDVLADIAGAFGLETPDAGDDAAVVADWHEGRSRGVRGSPQFFIDGNNFFCPTLDIKRVGNHLRIAVDAAGYEEFLACAFGPSSPGALVRPGPQRI